MSESLLLRIAASDPTAVQSCIDRYGGLIWSLARRFLRNEADAEDAVQDIFADLWSNAGRFDPDVASEKTFVTMIARRRLIDRQRREHRKPPAEALPEALTKDESEPGERLAVVDEAAKVGRLMKVLKPDQRRALELSIVHGWSHQVIAERLEIPLGTIKSHIRRGLAQIREMVAAEEGER